jgi:hypothetical protein
LTNTEKVKLRDTATVDRAIKRRVPVVSESFLDDCTREKKLLPFEKYLLVEYEDNSEESESEEDEKPKETPIRVRGKRKSQSSDEASSDDEQVSGSDNDDSDDEITSVVPVAEPSEDMKRLLSTLRKLYGFEDCKPLCYDVVFTVDGARLYTSKALLAVSCEYFKNILVQEDSLATSSALETIDIQDVTKEAFSCIIEYIYTTEMTIDRAETALQVIDYAQKIQFEQAVDKAKSSISESVEKLIQEKDMAKGLSMLLALEHDEHLTPIVEKIQSFMNDSMDRVFSAKLFLKFTKSMMIDLLHRDDLSIDEKSLFEHVIEWGVEHYPTDHQDPGTCATVYVLQNEKVQIVPRTNLDASSVSKIVPADELRRFLADLLPLVRFEHIDQESIFKLIDSKKLFAPDEMLQFIKAAVCVKTGEPYSIMGQLHSTARLARAPGAVAERKAIAQNEIVQVVDTENPPNTEETKSPESPGVSHTIEPYEKVKSFSYTVLVESVLSGKGRIILPTFQHLGSTWYVTVMTGVSNNDRFLSIYLYNKVIADGAILSPPITTSIAFRLINQANAANSRRRKFVKTWEGVKAWGYANVISVADLQDAKNGWLAGGNMRIEVVIEHMEN